MFTCPVCYYAALQEPPRDYNICECCGTEFGVDDEFCSYAELREKWIQAGAQWFFRTPPVSWNPWVQLLAANVARFSYEKEFAIEGDSVAEYEMSAPGDTAETLAYAYAS